MSNIIVTQEQVDRFRKTTEVMTIGEKTFNKKYALESGIVLTENEYEIIKDKYKGHFKQAEKNRK